MSHKKAVVLNIEGNVITVLLDDGSFERIHFQQPVEIGMEIKMDNYKRLSPARSFCILPGKGSSVLQPFSCWFLWV
jgi:hypothetical protein